MRTPFKISIAGAESLIISFEPGTDLGPNDRLTIYRREHAQPTDEIARVGLHNPNAVLTVQGDSCWWVRW